MFVYKKAGTFSWESNLSDSVIINGTNIGNFYDNFELVQYFREEDKTYILVKDLREKASDIFVIFKFLGNKIQV
jgi:hypothetical protein